MTAASCDSSVRATSKNQNNLKFNYLNAVDGVPVVKLSREWNDKLRAFGDCAV